MTATRCCCLCGSGRSCYSDDNNIILLIIEFHIDSNCVAYSLHIVLTYEHLRSLCDERGIRDLRLISIFSKYIVSICFDKKIRDSFQLVSPSAMKFMYRNCKRDRRTFKR